jgi:hypothetical protein
MGFITGVTILLAGSVLNPMGLRSLNPPKVSLSIIEEKERRAPNKPPCHDNSDYVSICPQKRTPISYGLNADTEGDSGEKGP